ncbi:hypothetical protein [Paramesorhizobium deserti]|uniref:hypothetical protein n=1 Tax=Paramesorhizobium deserti TaxID=1494590 RepID=UPI0012904E62|nr:hypothetical protein [Paramesorhizobium deserti]
MIGLDVHRLAAVDGLSWQLDLLPTGHFYPQPELSRFGISEASSGAKSASRHGNAMGGGREYSHFRA